MKFFKTTNDNYINPQSISSIRIYREELYYILCFSFQDKVLTILHYSEKEAKTELNNFLSFSEETK